MRLKNDGNDNKRQNLRVLIFPWRRFAIALIGSGICCLLAASVGSVSIDPITTLNITLSRLPFVDIAQTWPQSLDTILWNLRFPRVILALLVGASLSVAGATYQGLFRNPLADPYFIGVASGAALGATIVFLSGIPFATGNFSFLPVASFVGGISSVSIAYLIARKSTGTGLPTLILAGVAIGSFATAMTSVLMIRSEPDLRPLLSWIMGGFIRAKWSDSLFLLPYFTFADLPPDKLITQTVQQLILELTDRKAELEGDRTQLYELVDRVIVEHIDTGSLMFCPGSQISDKPLKDISHLMNEPQKFALIKLDKVRGNASVSYTHLTLPTNREV